MIDGNFASWSGVSGSSASRSGVVNPPERGGFYQKDSFVPRFEALEMYEHNIEEGFNQHSVELVEAKSDFSQAWDLQRDINVTKIFALSMMQKRSPARKCPASAGGTDCQRQRSSPNSP